MPTAKKMTSSEKPAKASKTSKAAVKAGAKTGHAEKIPAPKQRLRIKIKAFDNKVIDDTARMIIDTAERTGANIAGPIPLPTHIEKFTVNKSTFVHKNAREQYEIRTHKRLLDLTDATSKTMESLSSLSLPAGVDIEIKMVNA